jgi:antitoxin component of MazEF toxin-antitoxin module
MKKNSGENFQPVQVDPITGNYYVIIPEWIANELSWYEDTELQFNLEGNEVILSESTNE